MLFFILCAIVGGSILSLGGGALLLAREAWARRVSLFFVSFAVGALIGAAFFDLLPEAVAEMEAVLVFQWAAGGMVLFFLIEKVLRICHCGHQHAEETDAHVLSASVLVGDAVHNFVDGVAIAASFLAGVPLGVMTTLAVFLHEIPQEMGDFGVLLHAGYSRAKVFFYNLLSAGASLAGGVLGYFFLPYIGGALPAVLGFTAGMFLYIAASDLIPEVHHKSHPREFWHVAMIFFGLALVFVLGQLVPE